MALGMYYPALLLLLPLGRGTRCMCQKSKLSLGACPALRGELGVTGCPFPFLVLKSLDSRLGCLQESSLPLLTRLPL